jgi:exopolysaccharide biosynthesis polyprenyl glycosylphosphotransferase
MALGIDEEIQSATQTVNSPSTFREETRRMRRLAIGWAVIPLVVLDAACITLSMGAAYQVRFKILPYNAAVDPSFYIHVVAVGLPLWLIIFALCRLYEADSLFGGLQEYGNVVNACTAGLVGLVIYSFVNRRFEYDISRGWLVIVWCLSIAGVTLTRFGYRRLIYYLRRLGVFIRRALIVGANDEGRAVARQLCGTPTAGLEVIGYVDSTLSAGVDVEGLPVLGGPEALAFLVRLMNVEELIVIPTALRRDVLLGLYRDWGTQNTVRVRLSSGLYELFTTGVKVSEVGFIPLLSLNRTRITGLDALMKTALDYIVAAIGLCVLAPFFAVIALWIRLDSPGPVVYRRRVLGLYGRAFDAYKLRTMVVDADSYLEAHPRLKEQWERGGKIHDDPRITRVGRFLRRFSIDEFPQLVNVLKGEMSLVGPRMIAPDEWAKFGRWRHNLLTVKPGLTGLWQVSGRADLSYEDRVRLDMYYIRNHTIWLDLKVMFHTAQAVIKGRGAY